MKNSLIIQSLFVVITLVLTCCKEEQIITKPPEFECLVERIENNFGYIDNYHYDNSGRITKYSGGQFEYENNIVKIDSKTEFTLNEKGNVYWKEFTDKGIVGEDFVTVQSVRLCEYNSEDFLISEIDNSIVTSTNIPKQLLISSYTYTYENGNKATCTYLDNKFNETVWLYKYYSNLPNQLALTNQRINFDGKQSKNLIQSIEILFNGISQGITNYTYEFDNQGKLLKETATKAGQKEITRKFFWNCN